MLRASSPPFGSSFPACGESWEPTRHYQELEWSAPCACWSYSVSPCSTRGGDMLALTALQPAQGKEPGHLHAGRAKGKKKKDCKHPVPAWHSPNKRFADAAQAGLGLQCAKSRLSVSLIAAAISPGWSFPEPCSPQPPQQTFFFPQQSLYLPCICYPSPQPPGGVWPSKGGEKQEICMCHLLLCSSQELSPHSPPIQHSL